MKDSHWLLILLVLVTIAFAPAVRNGLNGDDHALLEGRVNLMNSSDGLKQLLTHPFWWGTSETGSKQYLYRPWVTFTYWFEFQVGSGRVWVFHLSNVLVHVANVALLYVFLRPIMGLWPSLIVAAFAGLNPAAVSTVGWSAERTALWAQLFTLLFLIGFRRIRPSDRQRGLWIGGSMLSYFLAIASMEIAFFAPLLAALFDWASPRLKPLERRSYSRYLWLVIPIAVWFGLRAAADIPLGAGMLSQQFTLALPFLPEENLRTFWNAIFSPHYVCEDDLLWSHIHQRGFLFYAGWLLFLGLIVLILSGIKQRRLWAVGGLWFGVVLFPVYAFGQAFAPLSDIYTYAALPGIGLFLVDGIRVLWQRYSSRGVVPQFAPVLIVAILVMYGIQSFVRVPIVKDDDTLWTHMVKVRPNYVPALLTVSELNFQSGDEAKGFQFLDKALAADSSSVDVRVQYLAKSLEAGRLDLARSQAEALERSGNGSFTALVWLAKYYLETGNCPKALEIYHRAETLHIPTPDILFDYGRAFLCVNDYESALQAYQMALQLRPQWLAAYNNLGICYENLGQYVPAVEAYQAALQLDPKFGQGWRLLAIAAAKMGDVPTLQNAVQQFLNLQPPSDQIEALQKELAALGLSWEISPTP